VGAHEGGGLPSFVFIAAAVLTAGAGAALIWSGVDTLSGVDEYERLRTPELLAEGQSKETRTNVLIGVTGALAIATVVLAIFTDWGGGDEDDHSVGAALAPLPGGAAAFVEGRF
jgi:hypothetical protein